MTAKTFEEIQELAARLALMGGDASEAFRESIINDMIEHGYSRDRAAQVIDEEVARAKKSGR
jgi:hypothetical protein